MTNGTLRVKGMGKEIPAVQVGPAHLVPGARRRTPSPHDGGFGRIGGTAVVDELTEVRWVTVPRGSHPFPC